MYTLLELPLFTFVEVYRFFKSCNNYLSCIVDCSFVPKLISLLIVNPLTTDDNSTCHATFVACYQLVHFVLKIISKRWGHSRDMPYTWCLF